jgi:hypothetical protein
VLIPRVFYHDPAWSTLTKKRSHIRIERRVRVANTPASYLEGLGFKYRPGDLLFWWIFFVVFLTSSRRMPGYYLKIRPRPLPSTSFPIHHNSLITLSSALCSMVTEKSSWNKLRKQHIRKYYLLSFQNIGLPKNKECEDMHSGNIRACEEETWRRFVKKKNGNGKWRWWIGRAITR